MMSRTAEVKRTTLRILFLSSAASTHMGRWVNAIVAHGSEVHLLSLDRVQVQLDPAVQCHRPPFPPKWGYIANGPWARKLIARVKPDLIHAHYATGYGTLAALAGFHPTILSVWGSDVIDFPHQSVSHRRLLEFNLARADKILSTSHVMATETAKYTDKPVKVTPFGIDLDQFRPRPVDSVFDPGDVVIGTVKTLEEKYRIEYLIQAFALLKQRQPERSLKLLIVGWGSQEVFLRGLAQDLGIAVDTVFTGKVPHAETPKYQNMLTVSVTPSILDSESFSRLFAYPPRVRQIVLKQGARALDVPPISDGANALLYTGNASDPRFGVDLLVWTAERARETLPELRLLLVCPPTGLPPKELLARRPWIELLSLHTDEIPALLPQVRVLVNPLRDAPYHRLQIPTEIMAYLGLGRPILSTDLPEIAAVIRDAGAGIVVPDSVEGLAEGILSLFSARLDEVNAIGQNALCAVREKHAWRHRARQIMDIFAELRHPGATEDRIRAVPQEFSDG